MYRAHSKDINRNKSFHPLTYGNLRRVEVLKEQADEKNQQSADRQKELHRDQEERRYDELVLANSADSLSGELARFRQTKNIFKAEYEVENTRKQQEAAKEEATSTAGSASSSPSAPVPTLHSPFAATTNSFLSKFRKEDSASSGVKPEVKAEPTSSVTATPTAGESGGVQPGKRPRESDDHEGGATTGFVTGAEAAQLRKELNLAQKQRHDPLMRVKQYQNSCVASAARQQQQQQDGVSEEPVQQGTRGGAYRAAKGSNDALQSRIRELLELKKNKK